MVVATYISSGSLQLFMAIRTCSSTVLPARSAKIFRGSLSDVALACIISATLLFNLYSYINLQFCRQIFRLPAHLLFHIRFQLSFCASPCQLRDLCNTLGIFYGILPDFLQFSHLLILPVVYSDHIHNILRHFAQTSILPQGQKQYLLPVYQICRNLWLLWTQCLHLFSDNRM